MSDKPPLLTSVELARRLGLAARSVQRYRALGLIEPAGLSAGGHARWVEADVREQMRDRRQQVGIPVAEDRKFITTGELARVLGLTPTTIQRYRKLGLLTPAEESIGGHARWVEADVRAEMRRQREQREQVQAEARKARKAARTADS